MILIGDVQGCQHRQTHRIDRIRSLGNSTHLRIHILRQLQNIFCIRSPQVISLIKNLHPHAAVLRVLQCRILGSCSHNRPTPEPLSHSLSFRAKREICCPRPPARPHHRSSPHLRSSHRLTRLLHRLNLLQHLFHAPANLFSLFP